MRVTRWARRAATAALAAVMLAAGSPVASASGPVARFSDVPPDSPFFADIEWLATSGLAGGYDDGRFRPDAPISRQAMAAFLHRLAAPAGYVAPATPTSRDVPTTSRFFAEIEWLLAAEVAGGYEDGAFRPQAGVSRQAMAAFLYRLVDPVAVELPAQPTFSDVPAGAPFHREIEWLAAVGIAEGYPDGTFRPGGVVSRQAMAAFLHRAVALLPARSVADRVAGGAAHSVALRDGTVLAWGLNSNGQLGDGTTVDRRTPVPVPGLTGVVSVAAGDNYTLALTVSGEVYAWGDNDHAQLGDGSTLDRATPGRVAGLPRVVAVAAGCVNSYALTASGHLYAWGPRGSGTIGDGEVTGVQTTPVRVPGLENLVTVAAGCAHAFAVDTTGTTSGWGLNHYGQLGMDDPWVLPLPETVPGLVDVLRISADYEYSTAVDDHGRLLAWGANWHGELGNGTFAGSATPTPVPGLSGVVRVAAAAHHVTAVTDDGTVWTWGDNGHGELGDPATTGRTVPGAVPGLTGVVEVAAGQHFSLAVTASGAIYAWGDNHRGQLGDGSTTNRHAPIPVALP